MEILCSSFQLLLLCIISANMVSLSVPQFYDDYRLIVFFICAIVCCKLHIRLLVQLIDLIT